ncbi:hypothetical protein PHLCEN_2v12495, partial [Hermanssonia centrifuga]
LTTASFGILVKQWLREYIAIDYTSPRARLRARQFRYPGLAKWKVFEIAALLPLLLQLSLGLFFVGLCMFTWSIHPSIGKTSTTIIAGWGFLLVTVTIAPVLSPRCPYKTTLLKVPLKSLRRLLRRSYLFRTLYWKLRNTTTKEESPIDPTTAAEEQLALQKEKERLLLLEEDEAVTNEKSDSEMLVAVDTILLDDDLLRTTMYDSLRQMQPDPADVVKFVLQVIDNRLQRKIYPPSLEDLRQLTKTAWNAVVDIIADTLIRNFDLGTSTTSVPKWMEDALIILLSLSDFALTKSGNQALSKWMSVEVRKHASRVIASHVSDDHWFAYPLRRLCTLYTISPSIDLRESILYIVRDRLAGGDPDMRFSDMILTRPEVPTDIIHTVLPLLLDKVKEVSTPASPGWTATTNHTWETIMSIPMPLGVKKSFSELLELVVRGRYLFSAIKCIASLNGDHAIEPAAVKNFVQAYTDIAFEGRYEILHRQVAMLMAYVDGVYKDAESWEPISPVRLCRLYLQTLDAAQKTSTSESDVELRSNWQELWNIMASAIRYLKLTEHYDVPEHRQLAEECLTWLQDLDDGTPPTRHGDDAFGHREEDPSKVDYRDWLRGFKVEESMFPDDLVRALSSFVPHDVALMFNRVKRIYDPEVRMQAFASGMQGPSQSDNDAQVSESGGQATTYSNHSVALEVIPRWKILIEMRSTPSDIIRFVRETIATCLPGDTLFSSPSSIFNLRHITRRSWEDIIDIIADTVINDFDLDLELSSWMEDALVILLSFSDFSLTRLGSRALSLWMSPEARMHASRMIASHTPDYKSFTHVLHRLRTVFASCPTGNAVLCVQDIVRSRIANNDSSIELWDIMRTQRALPEDAIHVALLILSDILTTRLSKDWQSLWAADEQAALQRRTILQNQRDALEEYINGVFDNPGFYPMSPVRLCRLYLRILNAAQTNDALDVKLRADWQAIWNGTAKAISHLRSKEYDVEEHRMLAEEALVWLDELDDGRPLKLDAIGNEVDMEPKMDYAEWLKDFKFWESMFPDELFDALSTFVLDGTAMKFKRVRRSRELSTSRGR